jgi:hypothetical protein
VAKGSAASSGVSGKAAAAMINGSRNSLNQTSFEFVENAEIYNLMRI